MRNYKSIIKQALFEDAPYGDITSDLLKIKSLWGKAQLIAKQDLILSGADLFLQTFKICSPKCRIQWMYKNGDRIKKGKTVALIQGPYVALLKAERVGLNFLGPLSGIATLTSFFVEKLKGTSTRIMDTRKTRPLYRELEKLAVVHGGGKNHRKNLSDQILVKENHIRTSGGIHQALSRIRGENTKTFLEIEVTQLKEVLEVTVCHSRFRVDRIMLDNMSNTQIKKAVKKIRSFDPFIEIEASGNMSLKRVRSVAQLGVDFISVGAITHSAPTADFSLLIEESQK